MQELRFVSVSEDGRYAVLAVPGRSARFMLPIDERLRAVALGQTSRLAQYEIEVESPLRPKEIQARIRAGETVEEIADAAGIAVERVRWFEGPVLAERAYIADQAQAASVRRPGESAPGARLGEITSERLAATGADPDDVQWDARKRGDGNWQVQLTFTTGGRLHVAEWVFDPRRRHVVPADDTAARMSLPGTELPQASATGPGEATVTRLAPRLRHEPPRPTAEDGGAPAEPARPADPARSAEPVRAAEPVAAPFTPAPMPVTPAPAPAPAPPSAPAPVPAAGRAEDRPARSGDESAPVRDTPAATPDEQVAGEFPAASTADAQPGQTGTVAAPAQPTAPAQPAASAQPPPAQPTPASKPAAAAEPASQPAATVQPPSQPAGQQSGADGGNGQAARPARKSARGRRSSVPSWDEIMLGSSRQND
ncbi:MAG TPA: septation protein SepH [Streptosporangiaceae bacterium]